MLDIQVLIEGSVYATSTRGEVSAGAGRGTAETPVNVLLGWIPV